MFELTFLGTSASAPSIYRGLSAQMVTANEHRFLIDCGEGTQRQILQSGLGFKRLNHIFLTHGHLDHILGLGGLLSTLTRWEALEEIHLWAGRGTLERVKKLVYDVVFPGQTPPVVFHNLEPGIIFEDKKFTISAFPVKHQGADNYGFLFLEKTRRPFLPKRAEALRVPFGPIRSKLVAGETITLENGRTVNPDDVLGEAIPGARYVHIGDCGETAGLEEIVKDADCLVMEATYLDSDQEMAEHFGHMTAGASARFARDMNVKSLLLTHLSRRNRESDVRREAQAIFPDAYVVRDFDQFVINRGKPVSKSLPPVNPVAEED